MTRFIQRWITSAVLSVSIVAAAVSASYGQEEVVRIGYQKCEALNVGAIDFGNTGEAPSIFAQAAGVNADQQRVADSFFALGLLPKQVRISDAARRPGT
jgi:hypothetical protein